MENFDYERELSKCKTLEDITGKNGLVQRIVKDAIEKILQKEFNEHLENTSAYRNGYTNKNVKTEYGDVNIKEHVYISNERHFEMLHRASSHIKQAVSDLEGGIFPDIVSIEIENAISSLGEITGQTVSDEIIHNIFAKFCLGK